MHENQSLRRAGVLRVQREENDVSGARSCRHGGHVLTGDRLESPHGWHEQAAIAFTPAAKRKAVTNGASTTQPRPPSMVPNAADGSSQTRHPSTTSCEALVMCMYDIAALTISGSWRSPGWKHFDRDRHQSRINIPQIATGRAFASHPE